MVSQVHKPRPRLGMSRGEGSRCENTIRDGVQLRVSLVIEVSTADNCVELSDRIQVKVYTFLEGFLRVMGRRPKQLCRTRVKIEVLSIIAASVARIRRQCSHGCCVSKC